MTLIVERATEENLADVLRIDRTLGDLGRAAYIEDAVRRRECYIARAGWDVLGFLILTHAFFGQYFIELLVVQPDQRRSGVATALIAHVEALVPAAKLFTSTNESNAPMQALLAKLGYVRSGWIDNLDEGDPELIYYKRGRSVGT